MVEPDSSPPPSNSREGLGREHLWLLLPLGGPLGHWGEEPGSEAAPVYSPLQ